MLARRLLLLVGVLIGVGGLYLREIETDASLVEAVGGTGLPTIWQSFSGGERVGVVVGACLLVAVAYRPRLRRVWDRAAAIAGGLLAGAAMVMLLFAYRDAQGDASNLGELLDLAVFSDLIPESPGASAGWGFFVSIGGFLVVGAASVWDLFARRPPDKPVPKRTPRPAGKRKGQPAGKRKGQPARKRPPASAAGRPPARAATAANPSPRMKPATSTRGAAQSGHKPPQRREAAPPQQRPRPAEGPPRSVEEADGPAVEGGDPDD
jgi:hypothetical protein